MPLDITLPETFASVNTSDTRAVLQAIIDAVDAIEVADATPEENIAAPSGVTTDEDVEAREAIEEILDLLVAKGLMEAPA